MDNEEWPGVWPKYLHFCRGVCCTLTFGGPCFSNYRIRPKMEFMAAATVVRNVVRRGKWALELSWHLTPPLPLGNERAPCLPSVAQGLSFNL